MAEIKKDCLYTETNEWVKIEDNIATVGIDDYSQNEFGEIVFVDLPTVGSALAKDDEVCVVESVKTASDICAPLSGKVIEINNELTETPNLVNESCYDKGWLYKIEISDENEVRNLISPENYKEYVS